MKRLLFAIVLLSALLLACGEGERPAPDCYKVVAEGNQKELSVCVEWHTVAGDFLTYMPCGGATSDVEIYGVAGMSVRRGEACGG